MFDKEVVYVKLMTVKTIKIKDQLNLQKKKNNQ